MLQFAPMDVVPTRALAGCAEVRPEIDFRLAVAFTDGSSGMVNLAEWLFCASIDGTVFEPLREEVFFRQVFVELGTVTWPNDADLAPDAMYDAIQRNGCWNPA